MSAITRTRDYDKNGILADLAAGHRQQDVAAKYGVSKSLVSRLAIGHGLRRRAQAPVQPCTSCGETTRSPVRICRTCQRANKYPEPTDADALTGGRWVMDKRRRVLVWEQVVPRIELVTTDCFGTEQARRRATEEHEFSYSEAKRAHSAYVQGDRSPWAVTGHRIYCRRQYQSRREAS